MPVSGTFNWERVFEKWSCRRGDVAFPRICNPGRGSLMGKALRWQMGSVPAASMLGAAMQRNLPFMPGLRTVRPLRRPPHLPIRRRRLRRRPRCLVRLLKTKHQLDNFLGTKPLKNGAIHDSIGLVILSLRKGPDIYRCQSRIRIVTNKKRRPEGRLHLSCCLQYLFVQIRT